MAKDRPIKKKCQADALRECWDAFGLDRATFCRVTGYSDSGGYANKVYADMRLLSMEAYGKVFDHLALLRDEKMSLLRSTSVDSPRYDKLEAELEKAIEAWWKFYRAVNHAPSIEAVKLNERDYHIRRICSAVQKLSNRDLKLVWDLCDRFLLDCEEHS